MRRVLHRSLGLAGLLLVLHARDARGTLAFPSVVDHITGVRADVAPVRSTLRDERASLRIEAADIELYGVTGLRSAGLRASGRARALIMSATLVNIASPVGVHQRGVVEAGCAIGSVWQGTVRAGAERLALDREADVTWRVTGAMSRVDVGRVSMLADLDVVQGAQRHETSLVFSARVRTGIAHLIATMRIDGDRFAGTGVAGIARVHPSLGLLAGYNDGSESLSAAVVIDWRAFEISTGVFQHPVLGISQGVTVACAR